MTVTIACRATPARLRLGSLAAFALCLLLPLRALSSPDAEDIVVVEVKGEVQVTMNGASGAAQSGATLSLPAVVQTGKESSVDLRQGETTIGVGPETRLEFPAPAQSAGALERVTQPRGNAFYDVSPRAGRRFRVETPYLVAVIKGTQFNVAADADSTTISLFEGLLEVRATDGDAVVTLNAGEVATRRRGEKDIRVLRLDDKKAAFAVPGAAGSGPNTNDLIPTDPGNPTLDELPDGSPLDDEVDDVFTPADTDTTTGAIDGDMGIDVGIDVGEDLGSLADTGAEVEFDVGAGEIDAGVTADLELGDGGIAADVGADIGLGDASVDLGAEAALDLDSGTVDAGIDAGADLGGVGSVDAGLDVGADLGAGTVDAGIDAGADLGDVGSVDAGLDVGADLDAGTVDAGIDADADLGGVGSVDVAGEAGVDLGDGAVDAGVDAGVLGTDVSADLGVDLSGDDAGLDVGIDLGLGGSPAGEVEPQSEESGGLLDGLLRGRGLL